MKRIKDLLLNWRIILLILVVIISLVLIRPYPIAPEGVAIRHVEEDSTAHMAGIRTVDADVKPMHREVITHINGEAIKNVQDYNRIVEALEANDTIRIRTQSSYVDEESTVPTFFFKTQREYEMILEPKYKEIPLNETEIIEVNRTVEENVTINETTEVKNKTITEYEEVEKTKKVFDGTKPLGLTVYNAPKTNIRKGLDLEGGSRVLLQPEREVTSDEITLIINNLEERLNVYGLSDIVVRRVSKGLFDDEDLISVEVAGANEEEVRELIGSQGKFEAKISNETAFTGDDIDFVCRSADCSTATSPERPCGEREDGTWSCQFRFSISISTEAAERQAQLTSRLDIVTENGQQYLSEPIRLYLDGNLVDELQIGADLQGRPTRDISISGPGTGRTREEAIADSRESMLRLQTILETGSLPVQLEIIKIDTISPTLGEQFLRNALSVGIGALVGILLFIFIRYRSFKVGLPVAITMLSEVIIILGIAAGIGWNLDLAAIAGIIIAIGTGIDDQVIILDETRRGKKDAISWKERIKRAFFIIFAAFFTTFAAMFVLFFSGAGLLRGFALTTILGITAGVLITRPAFAVIVEYLFKN